MGRLGQLVFFWVLAAATSVQAAQNVERIKLAIPAKSMGYLPMYVAIHRGFFRDAGFELEIPNLRPNIAHSALMGGDIEYHGLAESGLRLAAKGSPMKSLFFSLRSPLYFLMAKPQLKAVQDLKGKNYRHQLLRRRHRSVHTSRPASLRTRPGARRDDDLDRHGERARRCS